MTGNQNKDSKIPPPPKKKKEELFESNQEWNQEWSCNAKQILAEGSWRLYKNLKNH